MAVFIFAYFLTSTIAYCGEAATPAAPSDNPGYASDEEKVAVAMDFGTPPPADAPYRDASLNVEKRIDDLLPRLTDEEKMHLLHFTTGLPAKPPPPGSRACSPLESRRA